MVRTAFGLLLALLLVSSAQAEVTTLWVHGFVAPANEETGMQPIPWQTGETLWMNADAVDARANDTANGPGYCPAPYDEDVLQVGQPLCLVLRTAPGERLQGTFDHTFSMAWNGTGGALELDPVGVAVASLRLGANSGNCTGNVTSVLRAGDATVAQWPLTAFNYTDGYVSLRMEAPVENATVAERSDLSWNVTVACAGSGLFLGVAPDPGRTFLELPLQPAPVPTTSSTTSSTTTTTSGSTSTATTTSTTGSSTTSTSATSSTQDGGGPKSLPAAGVPCLLLLLAVLGLVRRRLP